MTADPRTVLARAVRKHTRARTELENAILQARSNDVPVREIAGIVGVSRPTVYSLLEANGMRKQSR